MPTLDIAGDARRTIDVIKRGGIALVPNQTGYAMTGAMLDPLQKIYDAKRRGGHKRNAMAADLETQRELMTLGRREQDMVERVAARAGGLDEHGEVGAQLGLADELGQPLGPQRDVAVLGHGLRADDALAAHRTSSFRLSRTSVSTPSSGPSRACTRASAPKASARP